MVLFFNFCMRVTKEDVYIVTQRKFIPLNSLKLSYQKTLCPWDWLVQSSTSCVLQWNYISERKKVLFLLEPSKML